MKRLFLANLFFVFPLIGLLLPSTSFSWSGPVLSISDGDTIIVLHEGKREKIRLYGIDCPEKDQVGGEEARKLTLALISGRRIEVEAKGKDRYGRTVGLVKIDSTSLNESLILNGYAWVYWQYCDEKFCSTWLQLEGEARKQKKGCGKILTPFLPGSGKKTVATLLLKIHWKKICPMVGWSQIKM
ncbi:MAG: thermonuclease family protein [Desulfobulbus sp.]|nr:thermonuclease family protein [Desulfobulbus sp.]